jgi:hypothetical protein
MMCLWGWNTVKLAWYTALPVALTAPNVITVLSALIITALGLGNVLERSVCWFLYSLSPNWTSLGFFLFYSMTAIPVNRSLGLPAVLFCCSETTATSSVLFLQLQSCVSMSVQCVHCTSGFSWVGVIIQCGRPLKNLQHQWQLWHIVSFASGLSVASLGSILTLLQQTRLALQVNIKVTPKVLPNKNWCIGSRYVLLRNYNEYHKYHWKFIQSWEDIILVLVNCTGIQQFILWY